MKRYFRNIENGEIYSISQVLDDFETFAAENPTEYENVTFGEYLNNCMTRNNGSLEEVRVFRLYRYGAVWLNHQYKIAAAYCEDESENGYFVDMDNSRVYNIFSVESEDENIVFCRI